MSMSTNFDKIKILIIDDDNDINNLFKIYLESDGCCRVDSYTNPIEAIYDFKKNVYDLILLDLKMPQIDGVTMFNALKKRDNKVIICMITADLHYLEQLKERIPNIEKYVIHKPILLRHLKDKINELVLEKRQILCHLN
ncbi:MAG TPA: response regulator [Nitrososphaeraceae archaeon]|nr:response regulator [Nitrososphaeraceae archaeon]